MAPHFFSGHSTRWNFISPCAPQMPYSEGLHSGVGAPPPKPPGGPCRASTTTTSQLEGRLGVFLLCSLPQVPWLVSYPPYWLISRGRGKPPHLPHSQLNRVRNRKRANTNPYDTKDIDVARSAFGMAQLRRGNERLKLRATSIIKE